MSAIKKSSFAVGAVAIVLSLLAAATVPATAATGDSQASASDIQYLRASPASAGPPKIERPGYYIVEVLPALSHPVATTDISSHYGHRSCKPGAPCTRFHHGIDYGLDAGHEIKSLASGTVTFAGYDGDFGYKVVVSHDVHGERFETLYAHMSAGSIAVQNGQHVKRGQLLGLVGNTGLSSGSHLHFEVIDAAGNRVNPEQWLAGRDILPFPG